MMSFTGSTRAGILVAQAAATTVKRVHQELGGKSANILLPDVDFSTAVKQGRAGRDGQQRPVLQRADAHVRAGRSPRGGGGHRQGRRRERQVVGDP
jgi:hypothetical protein